MTSPEDQNVPGDDATHVAPTKAFGADGQPLDATRQLDDAATQVPYYEGEWTPAYAQTEIRSTPQFEPPAGPPMPGDQPDQPPYSEAPQAGYGYAQPGYGEQGYAQAGYGQQAYGTPYGQPDYGYGAQYPPVGPGVYGSAQGPPPQVSNGSAIAAVIVGAMLVLLCYTVFIGVGPLVFGILSLTKSSSVANLWYRGFPQAAYEAVESSKNLAKWAWISLAIGVAVVLLIVAVIAVLVVASQQ